MRIKGKANKIDIILGVSCRPFNKDEEIDKILYRQSSEVLQSLPIVLMGTSISQTSAGIIIYQKGNSPGES